MPISNVKVQGDDEYPVIRPTDWLKFIDAYWFWDKLFGVRDLAVGRDMLSDFWSRFRMLHPNHELITKATAPLDSYIPIFVHGDEGTHYKKNGVMILQFQSALGQGTTLNSSINEDTFGNCPGYLVNQKGVTLSTRLVMAVMPREAYAEDPQPLQDLFEELCKNLRDACESGVQLQDGSKMHFACIGVKGDWPWLDASRNLALLYQLIL